MSGADAIAEIGCTFPARGICITNQGYCHNGVNMNSLFPEAICAWCGEKFVYYRAIHKYKRIRNKRRYYFCRYSCMVSFDKARPDLAKKRIEDCRKRLEYLESLRDIPREEWSDARIRDNGIPLSSMIAHAETRYNTAIAKWMTADEEKKR